MQWLHAAYNDYNLWTWFILKLQRNCSDSFACSPATRHNFYCAPPKPPCPKHNDTKSKFPSQLGAEFSFAAPSKGWTGNLQKHSQVWESTWKTTFLKLWHKFICSASPLWVYFYAVLNIKYIFWQSSLSIFNLTLPIAGMLFYSVMAFFIPIIESASRRIFMVLC